MIYDHYVKSGGFWYAPGEDVPEVPIQDSCVEETASEQAKESGAEQVSESKAPGKRGTRKASKPEDIEIEI